MTNLGQLVSHLYDDDSDLDEMDNPVDKNDDPAADKYSGSLNKLSTDPESGEPNFIIENNLDVKCSVCLAFNFKYKCPSCVFRTCSLDCFKKHKLIFDCSGLKNSLKFKRLSSFDDGQLKDDFQFLEDCNRQMDGVKRQKRNIVQSLNDLPNWLKKLKYEANRRMIKLKILPAGFKRRLQNKTTFMYSVKKIHWDVELVFTDLNFKSNDQQSQPKKTITFHIPRVPETDSLNDLLKAYLNPVDLIENQHLNSQLKFYQNADADDISVLIKLPYDHYVVLDKKKSISDCLKYKTIIEYPTLFVVLQKNLINYNVISENELRIRMQEYADQSYEQMIKNGLVRKAQPVDSTNSRELKNPLPKDSDSKASELEYNKIEEVEDDLNDEFNDADQKDELGYYEESDSDGPPEEVQTKFVFDNL